MSHQVEKHPVLTLAEELGLGSDISLYKVDVTDRGLRLHIDDKVLQVTKDSIGKCYYISASGDAHFYIRRDIEMSRYDTFYEIKVAMDENCDNPHQPSIDCDKLPEAIVDDFHQLFELMFHYKTYEFKKDYLDIELHSITPKRVYFEHKADIKVWNISNTELYYDIHERTCHLTYIPVEFSTITDQLTIDNVDEVCQRLELTSILYSMFLKDQAEYIQRQLFTFCG